MISRPLLIYYMYVYAHIHTYTYTHTHIHIHMYTYMHVHMYLLPSQIGSQIFYYVRDKICRGYDAGLSRRCLLRNLTLSFFPFV